MSKQKHKSFRKVLLIEKSEKVTIVHWCVVDKEDSKSIYASHVGATVYKNSVKHNGVTAKFYKKPLRILKNKYESVFTKRELDIAYTDAYWSFMGDHNYVGNVLWFDERDGVGYVKAHNISLPFYVCNAQEKVYKQDDLVSFTIHKDPDITKNCGAINIKKVA